MTVHAGPVVAGGSRRCVRGGLVNLPPQGASLRSPDSQSGYKLKECTIDISRARNELGYTPVRIHRGRRCGSCGAEP